MKTLTVLNSENRKLGHIAATYRTQDTCPTSCPLLENGCYAHGRLFNHAKRGEDGVESVRGLARSGGRYSIPKGGMLRANVTGDVLDEHGQLDQPYVDALSEVAINRPDVDVYTYTHAWRTLDPNVAPGVTINASCETEEDLLAAEAAGWPTVVADIKSDSLIGQWVGSRKVVACPAQIADVTCEQCRLCAKPNRKSIVAFTAHGATRAKARQAIAKARSG
jgi:hypothetical protein